MKRVIILGAGTAGSSTAISILSQNPDVKVLLVDRNFERKPIRCACGVSVAKLEKAKFDVPEDMIACKITCFRVYSPDLNFCDFKSDQPVGYVLKRDAFDRWLIRRAEDLGADLLEMNVKSLNDLPDFDVLVGADGFPSLVAKSVGHPQPPPSDIVHCVQKVCNTDFSVNDHPVNRIDMYFGSGFAPGGYAWVFPKDQTHVRVGLGVPSSIKKNPKEFLDSFSYNLGYSLDDEALISKLLPACRPPKTGVYGNVLLTGDSLPSVDPCFGEGNVSSIVSGRLAGRAIVEGKLENYDRYWKEEIGKRNNRLYRMRRVLYSLSDKDWNNVVKKLSEGKPMPKFTSVEIMRKLTRWVLLRRPSLIWKLLRG